MIYGEDIEAEFPDMRAEWWYESGFEQLKC
jgi:hypothetical protein